MMQFDDGTYGDIRDLDEEFWEDARRQADKLDAIFFGSREELEAKKKAKPNTVLGEKLQELQERVEELEAKQHPLAPTKKELMAFHGATQQN